MQDNRLYYDSRCIVTVELAAGSLSRNTMECIVTGGQCIVTQYTISVTVWTLFMNTVHIIFSEKKMK